MNEQVEQSEDVRGALIRLLKPYFKNKLADIAEVVSVDGIRCTVKSRITESTYSDIRLQSQAGNGVYLVPAVGSVVLVQWINDTAGYVAMYSDVESIKFLDGSYGGLIKIEDLVSKINNIESDINDIKTVFQTWVAVSGDGGAALKAAAAAWYGSPITETQKADIENDKITHGVP